jgi:hypothetical protein
VRLGPGTRTPGELCIQVQRGRMRIECETGETIDLGPGDALSYTVPWQSVRGNIGRGQLEYISVFRPRVT